MAIVIIFDCGVYYDRYSKYYGIYMLEIIKSSVLRIIAVNVTFSGIFFFYDQLWWILRSIVIILYTSAPYAPLIEVCIVTTPLYVCIYSSKLYLMYDENIYTR